MDKADLILLKHYGYNDDAMGSVGMYENVKPENLEKVKTIQTRIMGIGWPLKAIFGSVMIIPLLMVGYIVGMVVEGLRKYVLEKKYVD
ncbi:hypothetical protein [Mangrovimonas sp. TPBH4]|uniref:hypothetical protein n=1 Tax=Mangrovimonas sp. TPBH4 TaxID=1645914 RepID=UPI0012FA0EBA|nr:hypothetical protein [Mangrovimonas sp. TPBH4]